MPVELCSSASIGVAGTGAWIFELAAFPTLDGPVGGHRSLPTLQAIGQVLAFLNSDRFLDFLDQAVELVVETLPLFEIAP